MKLTPGRLNALRAVNDGKVTNRFDAKGNMFECPPGVSPRTCRQIQNEGLIEDRPRAERQIGGRYPQQLTAAGHAALAKAEARDG